MKRLERTPCDFAAVMQKFKINTRMLAQLLRVNRSSLKEWRQDGAIPTKYLPRLNAITHQKAAQVKRWAHCNLNALRKKLRVTHVEFAKMLKASPPNLTTWRRDKRIPRNRLQLVQELERQTER